VDALSTKARVWVLPNGKSLGLGAVLVAMWYAGASQSNGAAYLLCFVLAALAAVRDGPRLGQFAGRPRRGGTHRASIRGDEVVVGLVVSSTNRGRISAFRFATARVESRRCLPRSRRAQRNAAALAFTGQRRGCFTEVRLRVSSLFPLGFFTAQQRIVLPQTHYIYPAPRGTAPLPRSSRRRASRGVAPGGEGDDFGGVRAWRAGESQRHIDWKAPPVDSRC